MRRSLLTILFLAFLTLPILHCSGSDATTPAETTEAGVDSALPGVGDAAFDAAFTKDAGSDVGVGPGGSICPGTTTMCGGTCFDLLNDNAHCGTCDKVCAAGESCTRGACERTCAPGQLACNGVCRSVDTDNANCGTCGHACDGGQVCSHGVCSTTCAADLTVCGDHCANLASDPENCGTCNAVCPGNTNAAAVCGAGHCGTLCVPGYGDCDGVSANGCETDLQTSASHCGTCATSCARNGAATVSCTSAVCGITSCQSGYGDCNHDPSDGCEVYLQTTSNCGSCGKTCPAATGNAYYTFCNYQSQCAYYCNYGYSECDGNPATQCETNTYTDPQNCGYCGNVCSAGKVCSNGSCTCTGGLANCNGTCIDTTQDAQNCGGCGAICYLANASGFSCQSSACGYTTCDSGWADCDGTASNGCETHLTSNPSSCGTCGHACGAGEICQAGACVAAPACTPVATPKVLVYHTIYGSLGSDLPPGSSIVIGTDSLWTSYVTADFAKYDLIVLDVGSSDAQTAYATRNVWGPAITGRVVVNGFDGGSSTAAASVKIRKNAYAWLSGGTGTALYAGSDYGARSYDYLSPIGAFTSAYVASPTGYHVTSPLHPVMAGVTDAMFTTYETRASLTAPSTFEILIRRATNPVTSFLAARDVACSAP